MARGIKNKFVKSAAAGSEEELHTLKLDELIAAYNSLIDKYDAVLVKLDSDVGVTDTDYASLHGAASDKVVKDVSDELIPSPIVRGT